MRYNISCFLVIESIHVCVPFWDHFLRHFIILFVLLMADLFSFVVSGLSSVLVLSDCFTSQGSTRLEESVFQP